MLEEINSFENGVEYCLVGLQLKKEENLKKRPLVVIVHGGPHSNWFNMYEEWKHMVMQRNNSLILTVNYTGSSGYGDKFLKALNG